MLRVGPRVTRDEKVEQFPGIGIKMDVRGDEDSERKKKEHEW